MEREELWAVIVGYPYEISTLGRVRRYNNLGFERILKPFKYKEKYLAVDLSTGGKTSTFAIQGLVAKAFLGPRPPGHYLEYKDGNLHNNELENLHYVPRKKFDEDTINLIRRLSYSGVKGKDLALRFGCSDATISKYVNSGLER